MVNVKAKKKVQTTLTKGQNRLLKESLKKLLGNGLAEREEHHRMPAPPCFIKDAFNFKSLE